MEIIEGIVIMVALICLASVINTKTKAKADAALREKQKKTKNVHFIQKKGRHI